MLQAREADVESVDAIIAALYDSISGEKGERRDFERLRRLFAPNARMMKLDADGLRTRTVDDYIASSGPLLEADGFHEREVARTTEAYADIAHAFSTYEARQSLVGPVILRGINSIQLARYEGRWWVLSILWQAETAETRVPARYLNSESE